jgi:hypothetical protein
MLRARLPAVLAILIILLILSCKKENIPGVAGPQGPNGQDGDSVNSGIIFGEVHLYDSAGQAMADNSKATITFENSHPQVVLTTATDGSFRTPVMPAGFYDVTISKFGFGTMRISRFQHTGGENKSQMGIIELGQKHSAWYDIKHLQVDTVNANGRHYMIFTITLAHPQKLPFPWVVMYFSHAPGAGNTSNDYTFRTDFFQVNDSTLTYSPFDVDMTTYTDGLNGTNYVYVTTAIDNSRVFTYTDSAKNQVYPATGNPSNEVKVFNNLKN